ncbi:MAG: ECF transporter S component [Faecousia sp.]
MSKFTVRRIAIDAILIALFFAISIPSPEIAGVKLTFVALTTILAALFFGPVDAFLVGLLGAFLEQLLKYGLTATTMLWVLPEALRGLLFGLCVFFFAKQFTYDKLILRRKPYFYYGACIVTGMLASVFNTLVFYVDATLYGYYTYALIFGVFWYRLLLSIAVSIVLATVALPIFAALKKTKLLTKGS